MTAGYSGTPLSRKLGIKNGFKVLTAGAPGDLSDLLAPLPDGVRVSSRFRTADVALLFARTSNDIEGAIDRVIAALPVEGAVWVCWPKKASGITSELQSRDVLLPPLFAKGFVDVKIAAISETWSGLKFVLRKEHR
ncbi:MAG: DUF3052 domain-containing protein [Actinomycetia bacterium]|nr:DUF3052 domain-containing protein [Actinomycetes bacterium]